MHKQIILRLISIGLTLWLLSSGTLPVAADDPVVHAVLFYSPSCAHCHHVINEVLLPLTEQHGAQFQIIGVNVADPMGQTLYQAAIEQFSIPAERRGVPTLILGDVVLVGSMEIPEQLPGLVETYIAQGGLGWPAIPGLLEVLEEEASTATATAPAPTETAPSTTPTSTPVVPASPTSVLPTELPTTSVSIPGISAEDTDWRVLFARDPVGNSISVLVLLGMLASALYNGVALTRAPSKAALRWQWAVPLLVALGLIVAGYLAYVETQHVAAVCGPVGDCNAVQQSDYALLFGFLPIAVLGVLGYLAIGAAWAVARYTSGRWAALTKLAMVGMTWFGLFFSIYLTFLEPFVIGATCAWCLTSAVVMTLLLWVITPLTRPALAVLRAS